MRAARWGPLAPCAAVNARIRISIAHAYLDTSAQICSDTACSEFRQHVLGALFCHAGGVVPSRRMLPAVGGFRPARWRLRWSEPQRRESRAFAAPTIELRAGTSAASPL